MQNILLLVAFPSTIGETVQPRTIGALDSKLAFTMVADLDTDSKDPSGARWNSYLKRGHLSEGADGNFSMAWDGVVPVSSQFNRNGRGMELSALVKHNGCLLTMCDYTGMVYGVELGEKAIAASKAAIYPKYILSGGAGKATKPFKSEWATAKDGDLFIGSNGLEWVDTASGKILNHDPEWVKVVTATGSVTHRDWGPVYRKIREATGTSIPGYLWHEAVDFDHTTRRWIFLPRKASASTRYHPKTDELMGTNIMVIANEALTVFEVVHIGEVVSDYGFTAVRKVPGRAGLYMGLKVREVGDETRTVAAVFDTHGKFYSSPQWIPVGDAFKYEGLEFV